MSEINSEIISVNCSFIILTPANCVAKLKTDKIIFIEAIALKSVDNYSSLLCILKVCKTKIHFVTIFVFAWNETQLLKAREWSEDMGDFSLASIGWKPFDIDSFCRI